MIAFVVGTTAELIKIAPVFHELRRRGRPPALWFTGQHVAGVPELINRLDLPTPAHWLARGGAGDDLARPADVPAWGWTVARSVRAQRGAMRDELRADGRPPLVIVHGDTFTTVVGSLLAHLLRARLAHVEAGLRSGSLRSPFPEELNRRIVGRLTQLHFAPTPREVSHLRRHRGEVVMTGANTVLDNLRSLPPAGSGAAPQGPYGVATLHRFELVQDQQALAEVLQALRAASAHTPVLLFAGASERERFRRYGLGGLFDERLRLLDKLSYLDFLPVLAGAEWVVTDSGGLQEECAYLGIPCAVHRLQTERHQGLGDNVVLTRMDVRAVREFLHDPGVHRRPSSLDLHRPSATIAEALATRGFL